MSWRRPIRVMAMAFRNEVMRAQTFLSCLHVVASMSKTFSPPLPRFAEVAKTFLASLRCREP